MNGESETGKVTRRRGHASLLLLLIPVFALVFPGLYNRVTPTLLGFPFFYWYQLVWVFLATGVLILVYTVRKHGD